MTKIIEGILRIGLIIYTIRSLILSDYIPRFSFSIDSTSGQIGEIIGILISMYIILTFWGNHLTQGILLLQKKEKRKIKYLTLSGTIGGILLIVRSVYIMVDSIIEIGLNMYLVIYVLFIGVLTYFTIKDLKYLKQKTAPNIS